MCDMKALQQKLPLYFLFTKFQKLQLHFNQIVSWLNWIFLYNIIIVIITKQNKKRVL